MKALHGGQTNCTLCGKNVKDSKGFRNHIYWVHQSFYRSHFVNQNDHQANCDHQDSGVASSGRVEETVNFNVDINDDNNVCPLVQGEGSSSKQVVAVSCVEGEVMSNEESLQSHQFTDPIVIAKQGLLQVEEHCRMNTKQLMSMSKEFIKIHRSLSHNDQRDRVIVHMENNLCSSYKMKKFVSKHFHIP